MFEQPLELENRAAYALLAAKIGIESARDYMTESCRVRELESLKLTRSTGLTQKEAAKLIAARQHIREALLYFESPLFALSFPKLDSDTFIKKMDGVLEEVGYDRNKVNYKFSMYVKGEDL